MNNKNCASAVMVNPIIELLEDYPCKDKEEATHREQYWMEQFPNRLNQLNAIADPSNTYNYNRSNAKKESMKKYNDKISETLCQYTCECGSIISRAEQFRINKHKKSKKHINYNLTQLHNNEPNV
jgi:hypothetical protein